MGLLFLMIQRTRVNHRLRRLIGTEHHEQVAHHGRFLLLIEVYNLLSRELVERELHHRHGTIDNLLTSGDDSTGLLALEHDGCNLGGVCQIVDASLYHLDARHREALVELLHQLQDREVL